MWGNQGRGVHATQRCDCWWWRKYHSGGFQESQNSGESRYIVSWRTTSINTIVTHRFSPPREFLWRSLEPTAPGPGSWTGPVGSPWRSTVSLPSWTSATLEFLCSKSTYPCPVGRSVSHHFLSLGLWPECQVKPEEKIIFEQPGLQGTKMLFSVIISTLSLLSTSKVWCKDFQWYRKYYRIWEGIFYHWLARHQKLQQRGLHCPLQ